jgi:hypothetical protein
MVSDGNNDNKSHNTQENMKNLREYEELLGMQVSLQE